MDFLYQILGHDLQAAGLVVLNLIVIESLLSVDNAAVLATMVMDLPKEQREKALKYGILGAYVFRGLCLYFAAWLVQIWWLKPLGGLYLLFLTYSYFKGKSTPNDPTDDYVDKKNNWLYRVTVGSLGNFWATVALVELMDLAFSIDNVFAAVAFTDNINLIYIGVFIGILAMRFVAQTFVKLMEKFNFLETIAFIVIGVLGLKLSASLFSHLYPESTISLFLEGKTVDILISVFTIGIFVVPILTSYFFNVPKGNNKPMI
jgi:YkoY family integral membrane protein